MNKILIRRSIWKCLLMFFGCLAFCLVSGLIFYFRDGFRAFIAGILGVTFCGFGAIVSLIQLFIRRPQIIIDQLGITTPDRVFGRFDWQDIHSSTLKNTSLAFMTLDIKNPQKYLSKAPRSSAKKIKIDKHTGFGKLSVTLSFLNMKPQKIVEIIQKGILNAEKNGH